MIVSRDAPALGGVYKLVSIEQDGKRRPVRKLSQDKATYPDEKQVYRRRGEDGQFCGDILALAGETIPEAEPLLEPVLSAGRRLGPAPPLSEARERFQKQRLALPAGVRRIHSPDPYPLEISPGLQAATNAFRPVQ